ncbi:MAG TPA: recombinase family protein [Thermoanaerobaculia bacterium]|nr:recombinase family protein [Thermoanaerobaculia bacterium]
MKTAIIYTRVSSAGQALEGASLEAQLARAEQYATSNGFAIAGHFEDAGISGSKMSNRPGLKAALDATCKSKGVLIVYSLSRLARSVPDAAGIVKRLSKAGADFVSLSEQLDTTTATGKLIFHVLAAVAQFECDITGERTKEVLRLKKSKGERIGGIPFGFQLAADGIALVADLSEQATIADLRRMRAEGMTWDAIAEELNARGIPTKKGKTWTLHGIRRVALAA